MPPSPSVPVHGRVPVALALPERCHWVWCCPSIGPGKEGSSTQRLGRWALIWAPALFLGCVPLGSGSGVWAFLQVLDDPTNVMVFPFAAKEQYFIPGRNMGAPGAVRVGWWQWVGRGLGRQAEGAGRVCLEPAPALSPGPAVSPQARRITS